MPFEFMWISKLGGRCRLPLMIIIVTLGFGSGTSGCSRINSPDKLQDMPVTQIYSDADWYQARREPEQTWRGELRKREVTTGPATRTALSYQLVTSDKQIPVYAANVEQKLAPFAGRQVLINGKLIDKSQEGFGEELWVASIRELP